MAAGSADETPQAPDSVRCRNQIEAFPEGGCRDPSATVTGRRPPPWTRTATTRRRDGCRTSSSPASSPYPAGRRADEHVHSAGCMGSRPRDSPGHGQQPAAARLTTTSATTGALTPPDPGGLARFDLHRFGQRIIVARQNPSVNADTGQVKTGTPDIGGPAGERRGAAALQRGGPVFPQAARDWPKPSRSARQRIAGHRPWSRRSRSAARSAVFPALGGSTATATAESPRCCSRGPASPTTHRGPMIGLLPHARMSAIPALSRVSTASSRSSRRPQTHPWPQPVQIMPPMSIVPPGQLHPVRAADRG